MFTINRNSWHEFVHQRLFAVLMLVFTPFVFAMFLLGAVANQCNNTFSDEWTDERKQTQRWNVNFPR